METAGGKGVGMGGSGRHRAMTTLETGRAQASLPATCPNFHQSSRRHAAIFPSLPRSLKGRNRLVYSGDVWGNCVTPFPGLATP